jgi:hypothetical protein
MDKKKNRFNKSSKEDLNNSYTPKGAFIIRDSKNSSKKFTLLTVFALAISLIIIVYLVSGLSIDLSGNDANDWLGDARIYSGAYDNISNRLSIGGTDLTNDWGVYGIFDYYLNATIDYTQLQYYGSATQIRNVVFSPTLNRTFYTLVNPGTDDVHFGWFDFKLNMSMSANTSQAYPNIIPQKIELSLNKTGRAERIYMAFPNYDNLFWFDTQVNTSVGKALGFNIDNVAYDSKRNYTWLMGGSNPARFYFMNEDTNVTYNMTDKINTVITGDNFIDNLIYDRRNDYLWFSWRNSSGISPAIGYFNIATNASMIDVTPYESGFLRSGSSNSANALVLNDKDNLLYVGLDNGHYGYFDISQNKFVDLSDTDAGDWVSTKKVRGFAFDNYHNNTYLYGNSGLFGYFGTNYTVSGGASNTAPSYNSGYPQINSNDGSNSSLINLNAIFSATDGENATLKYNITWFTNNLTNFTLPLGLADYTINTINTNSLDYHNLTVGQTWKAGIAIFDGEYSVYANTSEILILDILTIPNLDYPNDNYVMANGNKSIGCSGSTSISGNPLNYEIYIHKNVNPPTTLESNSTKTGINYTTSGDGYYYWRCRANDPIKGLVSGYTSTRTIMVDSRFITANITTSNSTAVYSSRQTYSLDLIYNTTVSDIDAILVFDGIYYTPAETNVNSNRKLFVSQPISISSTSSKDYTWNLTITQTNGTQVRNQSFVGKVSVIDDNFALCNSSLASPKFLNITFKDEQTGARIQNVTIETSTFKFFVDDESLLKTYSFLNTSFNSEYDFCGVPADTYLNTKITNLVYKSGTDYPSRDYSGNLLLTNGTYNLTLNLLSASSGSYVSFQVLNQGNSPIKNVLVTASRDNIIIQSGYTDSAGLIVFFLNPNLPYDFSFSKLGYATYTTTLPPTQSSYTITLSTTETISLVNANIGINYTIFPINSTLNNNMQYEFGFNIQSDYNFLTEYGFILKNETATLTSTITGTNPLGSYISTVYNTGNNTKIIMEFYWIMNGTTEFRTNSWDVGDFYVGEYSVQNFCTHLTNFSHSGFNDFTRALIAFIIIMIITVGITYVSGAYTPIAIAGIITFSTAFLDFCGGFIPNIINAIPHFMTYLVGVIFIALLIDSINQR